MISNKILIDSKESALFILRENAAKTIQKQWKAHKTSRISVCVARIHELEEILTRFVTLDISKQVNELRNELQQKNTLCSIIEEQNQRLTDDIILLQNNAQRNAENNIESKNEQKNEIQAQTEIKVYSLSLLMQ